jgi:AcrR family transcriptional regulator
MGKPRGFRAPDYEEKRNALLAAVSARAFADDGATASFAELARAADVTVPTLRHYFGDRDDVMRAVFAYNAQQARHFVEAQSKPVGDSFEASLVAFAQALHTAWVQFGVGRAIGASLAHGLHSDTLGPCAVENSLEPAIASLEARILAHEQLGHIALDGDEPRLVALQFLSPVLIALLHQRELRGAQVRPLDEGAFLTAHARRIARAYAP